MDFYKGIIPIIDDTPEGRDFAFPSGFGSPTEGYGYVPRDLKVDPVEMFAEPPGSMELFDESEWDARYDEEEATKSSLEHLYLSGPNGTPVFVFREQNGNGYCWSYSTGNSLMLARLRQNQPLINLNPHSIAAIVKGGRDQGGWCGQSAKFASEVGIAVEGTGPGQWPKHSRSLSNDNPTTRAEMAKHKVEESWMDLTRGVTDQRMTNRQIASCHFRGIAVPTDYMWWLHSVASLRTVRIERGSWGRLILNSWLGWGRHGLGVLRDSRMNADGAVAIRSTTASTK